MEKAKVPQITIASIEQKEDMFEVTFNELYFVRYDVINQYEDGLLSFKGLLIDVKDEVFNMVVIHGELNRENPVFFECNAHPEKSPGGYKKMISVIRTLDTIIEGAEERSVTSNYEEGDKYDGAHNYRFKNCLGFKDGKTVYDESEQEIQFVKLEESGKLIPGLQSEQLLVALIDRHTNLDYVFPCEENEFIIGHLEKALFWMGERVRDRKSRNVMGKLKN